MTLKNFSFVQVSAIWTRTTSWFWSNWDSSKCGWPTARAAWCKASRRCACRTVRLPRARNWKQFTMWVCNWHPRLAYSRVLKSSFVFQVDFVNSFIAFSSTFVNAAPSTSEMALLCSMILLTPSRSGITDKCLVQTLRDKLVESLKYQVS